MFSRISNVNRKHLVNITDATQAQAMLFDQNPPAIGKKMDHNVQVHNLCFSMKTMFNDLHMKTVCYNSIRDIFRKFACKIHFFSTCCLLVYKCSFSKKGCVLDKTVI